MTSFNPSVWLAKQPIFASNSTIAWPLTPIIAVIEIVRFDGFAQSSSQSKSSNQVPNRLHLYTMSLIDDDVDLTVVGFCNPGIDGTIYRLDNAIGLYYIGSTEHWNLNERLNRHAKDFYMKVEGLCDKATTAAQLFTNSPVTITLIEKDKFLNRSAMFQRESKYFREHKGRDGFVNKVDPYKSEEELAADKREWGIRPVTCGCGKSLTQGSLSKHYQSKSHKAREIDTAH